MNDKVLTPVEVVSRDLYYKAREQANAGWNWVRLLLLIGVMGALIFASYFTHFRTHVMRAMVYNELPSNWWDVAIYVVVISIVLIGYVKIMHKIDEIVAVKIKQRHHELCLEYIDKLAEQERYSD